ncbi:MAG TPA: hypothetical protein VEP70_04810 [Burkholderiales bacterium]|nr:hypothetical protein [Burkholderiales bacterium]
MVDFVAAVPIETKTASRELTIVVVEADEFDQPLKTAEQRRRIGVQINHDLVMHDLDIFGCYDDRDFGRKCVMTRAAGDGLIGSQQIVEGACRVFVGCVNEDAQPLLDNPGDKAAGDLELGFGV